MATHIRTAGRPYQASVPNRESIFFRLAAAILINGGRGRLKPSPGQGKLHKNGVPNPAGNFAKGVAVEEKKRRGAMALKQKVQRFAPCQDLGVDGFPALADLLMRFGVMAEPGFSPFARSSVEAGDKLPIPVFDKSGSAL